MSYDGSNDVEELKTVPIFSENNNSNLVSDSDSDDDNNNNNKFFYEDIGDEVKANPKTTINAHAMKALQALYNDDAK